MAFVEKLEDMVQIIFLPLVSTKKSLSTPLFSTCACVVLYDVRTQHELGIDQYWYVSVSQRIHPYRNTSSGTAWGFVFAIATLDFTGKFTGCTLSSKALGFSWREATTVGSLMSCKGYVLLER